LHEQAVVLTAADLYLCMAGIAVALILLIFWLPTRSFRRGRRLERLTETEGFYDDSIKAKVAMGVAVVIAVGVLVYLLARGLFGQRTQQSTNDAFVSADYTLVVPRWPGSSRRCWSKTTSRSRPASCWR
jgi:hypothetical protein